jgi:predicted transcriptional regulator
MGGRDYRSKRRQEILDLLFERGEMTVAEIQSGLAGEVSDANVRVQLRYLEQQGDVERRQEGNKFVYFPARSRNDEGRHRLRDVLRMFFGGSFSSATSALLGDQEEPLTESEVEEIRAMIEKSREKKS